MNKIPLLISAVTLSMLGSGFGKELLSPMEMKLYFVLHRKELNELVVMITDDGLFHRNNDKDKATILLEFDGRTIPDDVPISETRRNEYSQIFKRIGISGEILVFADPNEINFVIATDRIPFGGGATERGISYNERPNPNLGVRVMQSVSEAEASSDGGIDLVPIEGNWYLYFENPS